MALQNTPNISILGDSISTLCGFTPAEGSFYHCAFARSTGIASVADTWWMKVIRGLGGTLLVNHSYAGSTVCRDGYQPANSPWRIGRLKKDGVLPDYILVFSGLNDVAFFRKPEEFGENYRAMLQELKGAYPDATICCGTLCRGYLAQKDYPPFVNFDACTPLSYYNDEIRLATAESGCQLVDLARFQKKYSSIDGVHPDNKGMDQLAQMWLFVLLSDDPDPLEGVWAE